MEYSDIIIDTIDLDQIEQAQAIYLPSGQMIQDYHILENLTYYLYIDDFRIQLFDYQENQILQNDLICQLEFNKSILSTGTTLDNWNFKIVQDPLLNTTAQLTIRCQSIIQEQFFLNYEFYFKVKTLRCQLGEILIDNQCLPCDDIKNISLIQRYCPIVSSEIIQEQNRGLIKIYPGFWRPSFLSNALQCYNPNACLGGWNVKDESCKTGHISVLCHECDTSNKRQNGIYYKQNNQCILCEYPQQYGLIILKLLVIVKFYQLMINYLKIQINQSKLNLVKLITSTKFYKSIHKLSNNINFTMLKILVFYNQLIIYFQYPDSNVINQFLSFPFTFVNGNLQCISTYYFYLIFRQFISILSILFIFATVFIKRQLAEVALMIFLFSLPSIFKEFLQISSYQEILGTKYVMDNFRLVFLSKYHIPIFIYGLCVFLIIIGLLFHYLIRKSNSSSQYKIKNHYLFNELKGEFNFWNLMKVSYQLLFITICQLQDRSSLLTIILILALVYTWALIKFKPYYLNNINSFEINIQLINILFYSLNFIHFNWNNIIQDIINYLYIYLIIQRLIKLLVHQKSIKYHKLYIIFWIFKNNHNQERALFQFKIIKQRLKDLIQQQLKDQISSHENLPEYKLYEDNPQNPKDWHEIEMPSIRK